jgi:hypothetical protein
MANPEHLKILKQGVEVWNHWKRENPNTDLSGSTLLMYVFNGVDFSGTNLSEVDFSYSEFVNANLAFADLRGATLANTTLRVASFVGAKLDNANLNHAILAFTDFSDAQFSETDFSDLSLYRATFGFNDLREVKGLESIIHRAPSTIGIDTFYRSQGQIADRFLQGCGVPDEFIAYSRSLATAQNPIQIYSCFISYSSKNQLFADRLYADLQNKGVRCWLASEDLKIGDKTRIAIDESIRFHDKFLLVLSKHSVASDWVEQEVETALDRERKEKRTVLFPIRLDDTVMKVDAGWPALIKNTRNIGDFRKWKNPEAYQKAFDRLLRDLKAKE